MKKTTRGWYCFADGTELWVYGLSEVKKILLIREHGEIILFIPTN